MVPSLTRPIDPKHRLPGLDFLRASAIGLVLFWHIPSWNLPFHWKPATWAGVDLFFVLSGYLIGLQLMRPYTRNGIPSYLDFFLRRALRVFPAFLVVILAYFLIPAFREQPAIAPLWRFLTFTMNFGLDASRYGTFSQAWSLCVEEHFYLILPVILFWLMRRPSLRQTLVVAGFILTLGMLVRAFLWRHYILPLDSHHSRAFPFLEYIYYPTYNRLDGLLVGVLIAAMRLFRPVWWARTTVHGNGLLAAGLVVLVGAFWICQSMFSFWTAVFGYPLLAFGFGLLVIGALSPSSVLAQRRVHGATLVATLSYSLYLTHKEVMHFIDVAVVPWLLAIAPVHLLLYLVSFLVVAALLYSLVERNGFKVRDRWLPRHLKELPANP